MATLRYTTIEERTQPTRASLSCTTYFFIQFFILINHSLRDPIYICPQFFPFHDPISRLPFAAHIRDPILQLIFATHIHDSHFMTPIVTPFSRHVRDYTSDSPLRHASATTLATPVHDSRSRPQTRLAIFCRDFHHVTPPMMDRLCSHPSVISIAFQP